MRYRDEFDEPNGKSGLISRVGPKAAFFVVLIALSFMIGVVWKLYTGAGSQNTTIPIVRADAEDFKVIPDDPGGMEIPHKDSTIFSSIKDQRAQENTRIENLLAEDENEEPLPRSQLFAGLNTEKSPDLHAEAHDTPLDKPLGNGEDRILEQVEEAEKIVENFVKDGAESVVERNQEPASVPVKVEPKLVPEAAPEPTKVEEMPQPSAPAVVPKFAPVASSGDYYIQLASVKSEGGAESEWKKLVDKYSAQLSGYAHRVEKADLGEKGTFYRIQAGPVSKDKATSTCEAIKKITPGGCLVKKN